MTKAKGFAILYKLSARDTRKPPENSKANLENDTEKREAQTSKCDDLRDQGALWEERKQSDSRELNAVKSGKAERFGERSGGADGTEKD